MSFYANELREHGRNDFDHLAADELDRLEDENAMLREALADIGMTPAEARAGVQRSRENKRDAERYRWLRNEHDVDLPVGRISWKRGSARESSEWVNLIDGDDLDRHIDAAMTPNAI